MLRKLLAAILIALSGAAYAADYKEFGFGTYPGWDEQKILSQTKKPAYSLLTLVPTGAASVDTSQGALYLYLSNVRSGVRGAEGLPMDIVAMMAVNSTLQDESGCVVRLLNYREEAHNEIPHLYSQFVVLDNESIRYVGVLLTTSLKGKVIAMVRPITLGNSAKAVRYDEKANTLEFDGSAASVKQELDTAMTYLEGIGE